MRPRLAIQRRREWTDPAVLGCLLAIVIGVTWAVVVAQPDRPTNASAEAGFARDMAIHHAQAVEIAQLEQSRTSDPDLAVLAQDIALTQQAQIGQLRGWLDQWSLPVTSTRPQMEWMGHNDESMPGMDHTAMLMPGLATPLQMAPLRSGSARLADIAFLRLMIRHHQGGIGMAEAIFDRTSRPEVRRFAKSMIESQRSELATLRTLLGERQGIEDNSPLMLGASETMHTVSVGRVLALALRYLPLALALGAAAWLIIDRFGRPRPTLRRPPPVADDSSLVNADPETLGVSS